MDGERIGPAPFAPRKKTKSRTIRTSARVSIGRPSDGQLSLQYFSQLLDIDIVCINALRTLRNDDKQNDQWVNNLLADEWKFKFDVPITTKY